MTDIYEIYEGSEPYIFISYAHKDTDIVMPLIRGLQEAGFRVWYDAGIEAGTEWPEYIADHLYESKCVICFITQNALESPNCRREINYSIDIRRNMLVIYLEKVTLSRGMQMQLNTLQALFRYRHRNNKSFLAELMKTKILQECRINVGKTVLSGNRPSAKTADEEGAEWVDTFFSAKKEETGGVSLSKALRSSRKNSRQLPIQETDDDEPITDEDFNEIIDMLKNRQAPKQETDDNDPITDDDFNEIINMLNKGRNSGGRNGGTPPRRY